MKIAVLGAGNAGTAIAADLSIKGHEVTLIKTSEALHEDNFDFLCKNSGNIILEEFGHAKCGHIAHVSRDISDIAGSEIIVLCVVSNYHEDIIKRIAGHIKSDQLLLICPGYFSTAYVIKYCADVTVAEAQSSFIDCRISSPGTVKVGFRNVRDPIGIYPARNKDMAAKKLNSMGFPLVFLSGIAEAALHNPNMIVHTVGSLMSIPRIDTSGGEYCMYHEAFTPHVWNILERLDDEKMSILERIGCRAISYVDACKFRNTLDCDVDGKTVFFEYAAMPSRAKGPSSVESRYITEDVPNGLVLLESFGELLGIKTPVCTSLIELAGAALGRDIRKYGRTVSSLGVDNVVSILSDGCPSFSL